MKRWMGTLLLFALLCGAAWEQQRGMEKTLFGVLNEDALEMTALEGTRGTAGEKEVEFVFPWLEKLWAAVQL